MSNILPHYQILNRQWAIEEIKQQQQQLLEVYDNDSTTYQNLGDSTRTVLGEVHSD